MQNSPIQFPESATPSFFHVFSIDQVRKLATEAGFTIKTLEAGRHPGHPSIWSSDTSSLQLVAFK